MHDRATTDRLIHEMTFAEFRSLQAIEEAKAQALAIHDQEMKELMEAMGLSTDPSAKYDLRGRQIYEMETLGREAEGG